MRQARLGWAAALTAALVATGAVPAAASDPAPVCAIDLALPARVALTDAFPTLDITALSPVACFDYLELDLVAEGGGPLAVDTLVLDSETAGEYLAGAFAWDVGAEDGLAPGRYTVARGADWTPLDTWLPADAQPEDATLTVRSTAVDVRDAARVTLAATRSLAGVRLAGTATRFSGPAEDFVAHGGVSVDLQKLVGTTWSSVRRVSATSGGAFSAVVPDAAAAQWRAVVDEGATSWAATSTPRAVGAREVLPAKASVAARRVGAKVTVTGTVTTSAGTGYAASAGLTARLQRRTGTAWTTVATAVSGPSGGLSATVSAASAGAYRWEVPATAASARGVSTSVSVLAAPRRSKVTASARRTGTTVTVTGKVAVDSGTAFAARRGVKVRLLQQSGTRWVPVRTVRSTAGGRLSATVTTAAKGAFRWSVVGTATVGASVSPRVLVGARTAR